MKIKDVCMQTGLTDRTVRFYVEKGLLTTQSSTANGRINREYSKENIEELKYISKLRQAGFSIQDIVDMQNPDNNISEIIFNHYRKLEEQQMHNEKIINELKNIHKRGNISWRRLASLLEKDNKDYVHTPNFTQYDELLNGEVSKNNIYKLKVFFASLIIFVFVVLFILGGIWEKYNERPLVSVFTISEVTFHDKWVDDGMFVKVSTNSETAVGYDRYFFVPQILKLKSNEHYEAIMLGNAPYMSVSIRIEIPYGEAKEYGLLDSQQNIMIDKVLEDIEFIQLYCTVESVSSM